MKNECETGELDSKELRERRSERSRCEVYSRIVGYLRPVSQWNLGKQEEFKDRNTYDKTSEKACC